MEEICEDILKKLKESKQIYIVGLDMPLSVTKNLFILLDKTRKEMAKEKKIPEVQFDFEDLLWEFISKDVMKTKAL